MTIILSSIQVQEYTYIRVRVRMGRRDMCKQGVTGLKSGKGSKPCVTLSCGALFKILLLVCGLENTVTPGCEKSVYC